MSCRREPVFCELEAGTIRLHQDMGRTLAYDDEKWSPARAAPIRKLADRPDIAADDASVVAKLRAGDRQAFEELVRRHGPGLLRASRRIMRNEEDARDCVQETFLAAHRSIDQFEGRASLGAWLRRIAVNAALMKLRARRSRPEVPIDEFLPSYDESSFREGPRRTHSLTPLQLLERNDTRKIVRSAIDELPENYRIVLLLRDIEGYTTAETAELLQATPGAIKVRAHRARTALKELLAPLFDEDLR